MELKCKILYGFENNQAIKWSWSKSDELSSNVLIENTENEYEIETNADTYESTLQIKNMTMQHKGVFKCMAKNDFGQHARKIIVRVKSKKKIINTNYFL